MIFELLDPSQVALQVAAQDSDGTPKLDVTSADVRVYHLDGGGTEIVDLVSTSMSQVGASSVWRYLWQPASLAVYDYVAEYSLADSEGNTFVGLEDVLVRDIAVQTDLEVVKAVETGRWKIENNQMTFYDDTGVTPLLVFDLTNSFGAPTMNDVFERVPV